MRFRLFICLLFVQFTGLSAQERVLKDISYISSEDAYRQERCKLDIYLPEKGEKPFKTLVWFHGGGLTSGSKYIPEELKNRGMAVVAPNYRLFPQAKNPEYTQDAAAALAWVFKHIKEYGGDASQIYVSGHSAGGYLSLMLCLDKSYMDSFGIDADAVKAYFPIGGQCATHYTIRQEWGVSYTSPLVDGFAPLNNVRKLGTRLVLFTGERKLEQMCRHEENLYLKAALEGIGNAEIPLHELSGYNHNNATVASFPLILQYMAE